MKKQHSLTAIWSSGTHIEMSPDHLLANEIVASAAVEYINGLISGDEHLIRSNERFFKSEWFGVLTKLDPYLLMKMCQKQADECKEKGIEEYKVKKTVEKI